MSDQPHLLSETDGHVAIVRLNRPKVLNALNLELMNDLATLLENFDENDDIRVILLAGSERAWAAGADIGDMATAMKSDMEERDQFAQWERIKRIRKPDMIAHHVGVATIAFVMMTTLPNAFGLFYLGAQEVSSVPVCVWNFFTNADDAAATPQWSERTARLLTDFVEREEAGPASFTCRHVDA